jgi:hypothetical protein
MGAPRGHSTGPLRPNQLPAQPLSYADAVPCGSRLTGHPVLLLVVVIVVVVVVVVLVVVVV